MTKTVIDFKLREKDLEASLKSDKEHSLIKDQNELLKNQLQEAKEEIINREKKLY